MLHLFLFYNILQQRRKADAPLQGADSLPMSNRDLLASDRACEQQSSPMLSNANGFRAEHGEREGPNDKTAANPAWAFKAKLRTAD